jgi:hypothetical protein
LQTRRAELAVLRARFALEKAQGQRKVLVDFTRWKKSKDLKSAVEKARSEELAKQAIWNLEDAKERKLERQIANCTIIAPRDGKLVYAAPISNRVVQKAGWHAGERAGGHRRRRDCPRATNFIRDRPGARDAVSPSARALKPDKRSHPKTV